MDDRPDACGSALACLPLSILLLAADRALTLREVVSADRADAPRGALGIGEAQVRAEIVRLVQGSSPPSPAHQFRSLGNREVITAHPPCDVH